MPAPALRRSGGQVGGSEHAGRTGHDPERSAPLVGVAQPRRHPCGHVGALDEMGACATDIEADIGDLDAPRQLARAAGVSLSAAKVTVCSAASAPPSSASR
jgi:hypothetical protein